MILLVLLHKGKGSGLSDLFGGGISSNYGGSSVVERNLDRITIVVGGLIPLCIAFSDKFGDGFKYLAGIFGALISIF